MSENEGTTAKGIGRFTKHMILGAVISGVACAIPLVNCINLLFCVLNMAGIVLALHLYLKAFPDDTLNTNESLIFGAIAGAGAGVIQGILGLLINLLFGGLIAAVKKVVPGSSGGGMGGLLLGGATSTLITIAMIPVSMVIYAAFGLLGSFLGMKLFFKERLRAA